MIYLIPFTKSSDVLRVFTLTRAISNLRSICLGVNILRLERSSSEKPLPSMFFGNVLLSKGSKTLSQQSKSACKFLRISFFFCFFFGF